MPSTSEALLSSTSQQERIAQLRTELKDWEHAFASVHDGRKPTREETKKDKVIAAKYKEYARLRSATISSSTPGNAKVVDSSNGSHQSSFNKSRASPRPTTIATLDIHQTPTKRTAGPPGDNEVYDSPLSTRRQRFLNRPDQVGPTPQKAGRVLGIFDSFIDVESTPPRSTVQKRPIQPETPSKINNDRISASPVTKKSDDVSPFLTPRKRKHGETNASSGPGVGRGDMFATPSALRQWKPPTVSGETESPRVRRPPPMPKRGLSSMLKELREMEDHFFDDDEEAMREMEDEGVAAAPVRNSRKGTSLFDDPELPPPPADAFVDQQVVEEKDENGEHTGKVWKKKGLKRQHRRVIMRPVTAKPKSAPKDSDEQSIPSDIEGELDNKSDEAAVDEDAASDSADSGNDESGDPESKRAKGKAPVKKGGARNDGEKGNTVTKKAVRKISANATSHMNFRKLNIKNKNSKGKGNGGRFGRRR